MTLEEFFALRTEPRAVARARRKAVLDAKARYDTITSAERVQALTTAKQVKEAQALQARIIARAAAAAAATEKRLHAHMSQKYYAPPERPLVTVVMHFLTGFVAMIFILSWLH